MAKEFQLVIVTPDKLLYDEKVEYVSAPGAEGMFGVYAGHVPLLTALKIGELDFVHEGKTHFVFISGGFAEVTEGRVTVLAESAEMAESIDAARAMRAKERAEERIRAHAEEIDLERASLAMQRAIYRIQVYNRIPH